MKKIKKTFYKKLTTPQPLPSIDKGFFFFRYATLLA